MSNSSKPDSSQNINITAENYGGITNSGDVIQNIDFGKLDFDDKKLQDLESEFQDSPKIEQNLIDQLEKEKFLVLGGDLGTNKNHLALQLAFLLAQKITQNNTDSISVKQWRRSSSQQLIDIELELRNTDKSTVFVFYELEPKDIAINGLEEISETIEKLENCFAVISTNRSFSSWNLREEARIFFPDLKAQDIYIQETLSNKIKGKIRAEEFEQHKEEFQSLNTLRKVNRFVELYEKAKRYSEEQKSLEKNKDDKQESTENPIKLKELIKKAQDQDDFVKNLYKSLSPREQLLAIGLSFFNGCFEDQLFAALERVIEDVWQKRESSLVSLDYSDLEKLENDYFELADNNNLYESEVSKFKIVETQFYPIDTCSLKILSLENRQALLKIAWKSYRRHIISALDVLVDLVQESVAEDNSYKKGQWELYGNKTRQERLRTVISETLSEIGWISSRALNSVQGPLLRLAKSENDRVRSVAASAISRWYAEGKNEQELLRLIQSFYSLTIEKEYAENNKFGIEEIEEESSENLEITAVEKSRNQQWYKKEVGILIKNSLLTIWKKIQKSQTTSGDYYIKAKDESGDYIGATVAKIVGEAIYKYHSPQNDELSNKLYDWLKELSESKLRLVHLYFGYNTLYWVVPVYLKDERISKMLKKIAQTHTESLYPKIGNFDLNQAIAKSLAHAYYYSSNRELVKDLLDSWYNECDNNRQKFDDNDYDGLLKTVVFTYGLIPYKKEEPQEGESPAQPIISIKDGFDRLSEILKKEDIPSMRKNILVSICRIIRQYRYFVKLESHIQDLVSYLNIEEEGKEIVNTFTEIYREQLADVERKKLSHQVEAPEEPPLTAIEKNMNNWVTEKNSSVQSIALKTLVSFSKVLGSKAQYK